jgi:hypothetical protein
MTCISTHNERKAVHVALNIISDTIDMGWMFAKRGAITTSKDSKPVMYNNTLCVCVCVCVCVRVCVRARACVCVYERERAVKIGRKLFSSTLQCDVGGMLDV